MIFDIFENKLRKLHPRLKIFKTHDPARGPWGLYLVSPYGGSIEHLCGISFSNGFIYELTERRWDGYIIRQGWRRVVKILIQKKITNYKKAGEVFSTSFEGNRGRGLSVQKDPLTLALADAKKRGLDKTGVENYVDIDDLVDIHRWREKLRQDKTNYWA